MTDVFTFEGVSKSFVSKGGVVPALSTVDLRVKKNEFVALIGPSGCGKSTLLNIAAGLTTPTTGIVRYGDAELKGINTQVGYMTQGDTLLPWRTALGNVCLPLEIQHVPRAERVDRARSALADIGLTGFEDHLPHQLSGGMRKRVGLARTLVYGADTLLMDEPFGALDAQLRLILQQQVLDLLQSTNKTVVFVTHDLFEAVALADRVVVFSARPGQIQAIEEVPVGRPRNLEAGRFSPSVMETQQRLWSYLSTEVDQGVEV